MDNEKMVAGWHARIEAICEGELRRQLSDAERKFVRGRHGFIALEMIQDTVTGMSFAELQAYLNSENSN